MVTVRRTNPTLKNINDSRNALSVNNCNAVYARTSRRPFDV